MWRDDPFPMSTTILHPIRGAHSPPPLIQVIESSWDAFVLAVAKPDCTLDTLIEEHAKYLNSITHKGLLGSGRSGKEGSLLGQLHELLKIIMSFKEGMVFSILSLYRMRYTDTPSLNLQDGNP
jgi:Gamma tubulin complex component C-terminal